MGDIKTATKPSNNVDPKSNISHGNKEGPKSEQNPLLSNHGFSHQ